MKALAALVTIQFLCRLFAQSLWSALGSTAFLILFAIIAYRWGNWHSFRTAAHWLMARPLQGWLVVGGTFGVLGLLIYNGHFHPASIAAEVISAHIVFYAFCAAGVRLQEALRR